MMAMLEIRSRGDSKTCLDRCKLRIPVMSGIGTGPTELSAFDAALHRCGVHDYNLMPMSSVIPPASVVVSSVSHAALAHEHGYRLYVVKAEARSAEEGAVIAAGLGWLQWADGRGIFVEHELQGHGQSRAEVEDALARQITTSLGDLARRREIAFDPTQARGIVISTVVGSLPTCALVLALYQADGWSGKGELVEGMSS